jgi:hypothetical protein
MQRLLHEVCCADQGLTLSLNANIVNLVLVSEAIFQEGKVLATKGKPKASKLPRGRQRDIRNAPTSKHK